MTITDYGELSELIQHNVARNLSPIHAARTKVDSFDWNNPRTKLRFPAEDWDVILISDVVWADGSSSCLFLVSLSLLTLLRVVPQPPETQGLCARACVCVYVCVCVANGCMDNGCGDANQVTAACLCA